MPQHPDPDALALHAVGEPALTATDLDHLAGCEPCRDTLAEFRDTVLLVRGDGPEDGGHGAADGGLSPVPVAMAELESAPPLHLWTGIAAELGLADDVVPPSLTVRQRGPVDAEDAGTAPAADVPAADVPAAHVPAAHVPAAHVPAAQEPAAQEPAAQEPPADARPAQTPVEPVRAEDDEPTGATPAAGPPAGAVLVGSSLSSPSSGVADPVFREPALGEVRHMRRPRRTARQRGRARALAAVPLLAAAACGAAVTAVGVAAWQLGGGGAATGGEVLAAAELAEFGAGEGSGASGDALVVADGEARVLELTVTEVPVPDTSVGFLEAWLIDPETGAMVSLGAVAATGQPDEQGSTVALTVPSGLDLQRYSVVDVSDEPLDGDPTHSGASLVRGELRA